MTVSITHSTPADGSFSSTGATAWNTTHAITGLIDNQVVFGSSGTLGQSSQFVWNESINEMLIGSPDSGNVNIQAANGVSVNQSGTNVQLSGGIGNGSSANGGWAQIKAGTALNIGGSAVLAAGFGAVNGGDIRINSGGSSSHPGVVTIRAQGANDIGPGGSVSIFAGDAYQFVTTSPYDGGDISLSPGLGVAGGVTGRVSIVNTISSYAQVVQTSAVLVTNVGPNVLTSSTISAWLPVKVDGTLYYLPMWK